MAKKLEVSLVHYNQTLLELIRRFPELKSPIEKEVKKAEKSNKYHRIIVGTAYSSRDSFPKSISVSIEGFDAKHPQPLLSNVLRFTCKWVLD